MSGTKHHKENDANVSSNFEQTQTTQASFMSHLQELGSKGMKEGAKITSNPNFKLFMNSVIASSVSNVAGIAATHPLDTLKIRMQLNERTISMR